MSLATPSVTIYQQVLTAVQALQTAYKQGGLSNIGDLTQSLRTILSKVQANGCAPLLEYEPVVETEPPDSTKMNRFWQLLQWDTMIGQYQLDILQAATILTSNIVTTQMTNAQNTNAQLNNKISALQLYTNSTTANTLLFGDYFQNSYSIDNSLVGTTQRVSLLPGGGIALGLIGPAIHLENSAIIQILPNSNGFVGNNQEVDATSVQRVNPGTGKFHPLVLTAPIFNFVSQNYDSSKLAALTDNNPTTWFEYEHVVVSKSYQQSALNYNFTYHSGNPDGTATYINWANIPDRYSLQLSLQFNLGSSVPVNVIQYDPFGMEDNSNYPVFINSVLVSPDGTTWTTLNPQNVWIGTASNVQTARDAANIVIGDGYWDAGGTNIQYVTFNITQPNPIPCQIGHLYYLDSNTGSRIEGPEPDISDPGKYNDPQYWQAGDLVQYREIFQGQRFGIGIRDISIVQNQYQQQSIMISNPFNANNIIKRVSLEAQYNIPATYPVGNWVQFFVSPDNGTTWAPISTIQNTIQGIPSIVAFNDPLPNAFRDPTVGYYNIAGDVTSIRVKIIISQPSGSPAYSASPVVNNYKLKVLN